MWSIKINKTWFPHHHLTRITLFVNAALARALNERGNSLRVRDLSERENSLRVRDLSEREGPSQNGQVRDLSECAT